MLFLFAFYFGWCLLAFLLSTSSATGPTRGLQLRLADFLGRESVVHQPDGSILAVPVLVRCVEKELGIRDDPNLYWIRVLPGHTLVNGRDLPAETTLGQYLLRAGLGRESEVVVIVEPEAAYGEMVSTLDRLRKLAEDEGLTFTCKLVGSGRFEPAGTSVHPEFGKRGPSPQVDPQMGLAAAGEGGSWGLRNGVGSPEGGGGPD